MSAQLIAKRPDTQLHGYRLALVRIAWAAVALFGAGSFATRLPGHYIDLQRVCEGTTCAYGQLSPEAAQTFQMLGLSLGDYALARVSLTATVALTWFIVAAVLAWRRSNDWLALLVALWFVFDGAATITGAYGLGSGATVQAHEASARAVNLIAESGIFLLVVSLFPTQRIVPRIGFWLLVVFGFFVAGPFGGGKPLTVPLQFGTLVGLALAQIYHYWRVSTQAQGQRPFWRAVGITIALGLPVMYLVAVPIGGSLAAAIFYSAVTGMGVIQLARYWSVASLVERQRTKWAIFGISVFTSVATLLLVPVVYMPPLGRSDAFYQTIHTIILIVVSMGLPFAIAFSIARYRLWDIDVLINRALVYGSLTAVLAGLYFGGVVGVQALLNVVTGETKQESSVVIVVTTIAIAALFQPLQHRIQDVIDRRFYRRKYDAAHTLSLFSESLRSEVELETLHEHLVAVVVETMQPARVSLWLRNPGHR